MWARIDWNNDDSIRRTVDSAKRTRGVNVETPAGLVKVEYNQKRWENAVRFTNIPSYLALKEKLITHPELGQLTDDIAFGGKFLCNSRYSKR